MRAETPSRLVFPPRYLHSKYSSASASSGSDREREIERERERERYRIIVSAPMYYMRAKTGRGGSTEGQLAAVYLRDPMALPRDRRVLP